MSAFARKAGTSPAAIRKYKKDGAIPRADIAVRIARAANVDLSWLLTGEGEMLRRDSEGLDPDAAEAAMLAIADTVFDTRHKLSDNSLKVLFEDFYRGFVEAGQEGDD